MTTNFEGRIGTGQVKTLVDTILTFLAWAMQHTLCDKQKFKKSAF